MVPCPDDHLSRLGSGGLAAATVPHGKANERIPKISAVKRAAVFRPTLRLSATACPSRPGCFRLPGSGGRYPDFWDSPQRDRTIAVSHDDQRRLSADAEALLHRPRWNDEEIDHAVALHDLLITPDRGPDQVTARLRKRLATNLRQRFERANRIMDLVRAEIFSLGWLDSPDPSAS